MAARTPTSARFAPYPSPLNSPLGPPTPTLAAQLSWMLQQHASPTVASPLSAQERHVHFPSPLQHQLFSPRSTPQPPSPPMLRSVPQGQQPCRGMRPIQTPRYAKTPRSVRFFPPTPQQPAPRSVPDADPPRNLLETGQHCPRCKNVLCLPPSASFIDSTLPAEIRPVKMDRSRPRCVACDLTRTKEMVRDIVAPVDTVAKLEADIAKMEKYVELGIKVEEAQKSLTEARNRLGLMRGNSKENVKMVWERFYGAWGPGVKAGGAKNT